jgi:hypothetical protein
MIFTHVSYMCVRSWEGGRRKQVQNSNARIVLLVLTAGRPAATATATAAAAAAAAEMQVWAPGAIAAVPFEEVLARCPAFAATAAADTTVVYNCASVQTPRARAMRLPRTRRSGKAEGKHGLGFARQARRMHVRALR